MKLEGVGKLAFKFYKSVLPLALTGSLLLPYNSLAKEKTKENGYYSYQVISPVITCVIAAYLGGLRDSVCKVKTPDKMYYFGIDLKSANKVLSADGKNLLSELGFDLYAEVKTPDKMYYFGIDLEPENFSKDLFKDAQKYLATLDKDL
ncbi:hypothetical protein, partial [Aquifex sp.]